MVPMMALMQYHVEMTQLCTTSKTFLGAFAMICLILGILFHVANYFWNSGKPKTSKKPLLWWAGTLILVLSIICIAAYIVMPPLYKALLGSNAYTSDSCYQGYTDYEYCGAYCTNKSIPKPNESCTCMIS